MTWGKFILETAACAVGVAITVHFFNGDWRVGLALWVAWTAYLAGRLREASIKPALALPLVAPPAASRPTNGGKLQSEHAEKQARIRDELVFSLGWTAGHSELTLDAELRKFRASFHKDD